MHEHFDLEARDIIYKTVDGLGVRTIQLADHNSTVDRALNMVPELVDKLTGLLNKGEAAAADPAQNQ